MPSVISPQFILSVCPFSVKSIHFSLTSLSPFHIHELLQEEEAGGFKKFGDSPDYTWLNDLITGVQERRKKGKKEKKKRSGRGKQVNVHPQSALGEGRR